MPSFLDPTREPWLLVLLAMAGCATTDYPRNLPEADEAARLTTGHWIVVYLADDSGDDEHLPLEGELIAVDRDSVFFFTGDSFTACASQNIVTATVFVNAYALEPDDANLWMILGTISTASHGFALLATAPVWLIFGSLALSATMDDADRGDVRWPEEPWETLAAFARFPQGLRAEIDRESLRPAQSKIVPPKRNR